jgi:hypothetical protein
LGPFGRRATTSIGLAERLRRSHLRDHDGNRGRGCVAPNSEPSREHWATRPSGAKIGCR